MSEQVIAVPSEMPGGLDATRSAHFGHSAAFTLVKIVDGAVSDVSVIMNPPHEHGGCMTTVNLLASQGTTAVAAIGMGGGPLSGCERLGIDVFFEDSGRTVAEAIAAVLEGRAQQFTSQHSCQGHHH